MKKWNQLAVVVLTSVFTLLSVAQAQPRALDQLYPGYPATIVDSSRIDQLFDAMPLGFKTEGFLRSGSQCFHRAEIWSYDMYRNKQINAMKVFVFYTFAYKQAYKAMTGKTFVWWFHVAPYVLTRDSRGNVVESVLDPTFADTPLAVAPWSQLFVETNKPCKEFVRYQDFRNEVEGGPNSFIGTEHCYLVRVPATDFDPRGVEARDAGRVSGYNWNLNDVSIAVDQASLTRTRDDYRSLLGL